MIYEYRVYEAAPGKLEALNARFRNHTLGIFERHGIKNIGYWTASVGDYSDRLIYIVAFEDEGQRAEAWASFRADPEWNKVRSESEVDGPLTVRITNSILNPTDYSRRSSKAADDDRQRQSRPGNPRVRLQRPA